MREGIGFEIEQFVAKLSPFHDAALDSFLCISVLILAPFSLRLSAQCDDADFDMQAPTGIRSTTPCSVAASLVLLRVTSTRFSNCISNAIPK